MLIDRHCLELVASYVDLARMRVRVQSRVRPSASSTRYAWAGDRQGCAGRVGEEGETDEGICYRTFGHDVNEILRFICNIFAASEFLLFFSGLVSRRSLLSVEQTMQNAPDFDSTSPLSRRGKDTVRESSVWYLSNTVEEDECSGRWGFQTRRGL